VAFAPLHAPLAVQLAALVDDHVSVLAAPLAILVGLATSVTDGLGINTTVTELETTPAAPVQAKVYVLDDVNAPVDCEPAVDLAPLHAPLAVQLVALVDDHVSMLVPPAATLVGLAVNETVIGGNELATATEADWVIEPPAPTQLRLKVLFATNPVIAWLPEVTLSPDHEPLAVQLVAFVDDHVKVLVPPLAMLVGLAVTVNVGGAATETVTVWLVVPPVPVQAKV
jgi:hypothetical protein